MCQKKKNINLWDSEMCGTCSSLILFQNRAIPIIFGYNPKSKDQYGIMMYHKNRLIKAYERVGCQLKVRLEAVCW